MDDIAAGVYGAAVLLLVESGNASDTAALNFAFAT